MDRDGDWQLVVHEEQEGLPRDAGTQAMVPFTGEGQAPFAGPLAIRVGRKAAGFVYTRQDPAGLLWKCERASDPDRLPGANLVLYLVWSADEGCWYAIDAPRDVVGGAPAIVGLGYPAYRTYGHAVGGGSCNWERNLNGPGMPT